MDLNKYNYIKINNYFKGKYKGFDNSLFRYVNVFSYEDLVQEYYLYLLSKNASSTTMSPTQFLYDKLSIAYDRKRIAPEILLSRITDSNLSSNLSQLGELIDAEKQCSVVYTKESKNDIELTRDLIIAMLSKYMSTLGEILYKYYWDYKIQNIKKYCDEVL